MRTNRTNTKAAKELDFKAQRAIATQRVKKEFLFDANECNCFDFAKSILKHMVSLEKETLPYQVATTVARYRRCSEKQAYVLARYVVETGLESDIDF